MAELTVALVGCTGPGQLHLQSWTVLSGVRIAAVCDSDGVVAARAATQLGNADAFTDVESLLAAGPFDIVDVCAPLEEQVDAIEKALRARANVLCAAPPTLSSTEARRIADLAQERERMLMPAFLYRFHPLAFFARELVENDDLGHPTLFRCHLSGPLSEPDQTGALLDTALHGVDLFRSLCGEVKSISGRCALADPERKETGVPEDQVAMVLESAGTLGVVEASWSAIGAHSVLEIQGTAGACLVDFDLGTVRYLTADQPVWQTNNASGPNPYEHSLAHFADAVRGLQPLLVTGNDMARAVELCNAIRDQNPER